MNPASEVYFPAVPPPDAGAPMSNLAGSTKVNDLP